MTCKNCGIIVEENCETCPNCNTPIIENSSPQDLQSEDTSIKYSGKGIAGFVLSLVGIIVAAVPCGIIGLVFSFLAMKEINLSQRKGKGMALSGIIISIIDIVIGIIYLAL